MGSRRVPGEIRIDRNIVVVKVLFEFTVVVSVKGSPRLRAVFNDMSGLAAVKAHRVRTLAVLSPMSRFTAFEASGGLVCSLSSRAVSFSVTESGPDISRKIVGNRYEVLLSHEEAQILHFRSQQFRLCEVDFSTALHDSVQEFSC